MGKISEKRSGCKETLQIFKVLKEVQKVSFYYGTDKHPKSLSFLEKIRKIGYRLVTKPVKYIYIGEIEGKQILKRKCDFDMEICIDVHRAIEQGIESYIFFTGDGDFEPLYKFLIAKGKQVIVIYSKGHLGREVWEIKRGLFKVQLTHLGL
ncbi:MAG: NYN domain-containing protein [Candidatus Anstonellales archaeon]